MAMELHFAVNLEKKKLRCTVLKAKQTESIITEQIISDMDRKRFQSFK